MRTLDQFRDDKAITVDHLGALTGADGGELRRLIRGQTDFPTPVRRVSYYSAGDIKRWLGNHGVVWTREGLRLR